MAGPPRCGGGEEGLALLTSRCWSRVRRRDAESSGLSRSPAAPREKAQRNLTAVLGANAVVASPMCGLYATACAAIVGEGDSADGADNLDPAGRDPAVRYLAEWNRLKARQRPTCPKQRRRVWLSRGQSRGCAEIYWLPSGAGAGLETTGTVRGTR